MPTSRPQPTVKRQAGITLNTAKCDRRDIAGMKQTFDIKVARPYINGAGCASIYSNINHALAPNEGISDYRCEDNNAGGTFLLFTVPAGHHLNIAVIEALQKVNRNSAAGD